MMKILGIQSFRVKNRSIERENIDAGNASVGFTSDGGDQKSDFTILETAFLKKARCDPTDPSGLLRRHRFDGRPEMGIRARLDLDEADRATVRRDEVDLPEPVEPVVPCEQGHASTDQLIGNGRFGGAPHGGIPPPTVRHRPVRS